MMPRRGGRTSRSRYRADIDVKAPLPISSLLALGFGVFACQGGPAPANATAPASSAPDATDAGPAPVTSARLPLVLVADVDLPGGSTRFDYEDVDLALGHLVTAHMNDGSVVVTDLRDGSVLKELKGIPTARGVVVADDLGITFVTSSPNQLVLIDDKSLTEVKRVTTGNAPDGVAWDATHKIVGVSDQGDGALSLIADSGSGARKQVPLGNETGNVVYDAARGWFWITAVTPVAPDKLFAVDPTTAKVATSIDLPGCDGAHGLRLHPDGQSALVACEGNDTLARVALGGAHAISTAKTGSGPDVLAIDPGLGWLYVAAESGDLTVFDLKQPGVVLVGHDHPGEHAHSVAVDPRTHRVLFPLQAGPKGTPVLRIMRPTG
jgi:DNA-binding beta-propeller fold protein YncE